MKAIANRLESNKILSFFFNRDLFALVYTTVLILWSIPLLEAYMDIPSKICFVWGTGLIFWDLLTSRRIFRSVYWGIPFLIIGSYCITALFNLKLVGIYPLAKHLVYLSIAFFLLYGRDRSDSAEKLKNLLRRLNHILILISFCTAAISILMFMMRYSYSFKSGELNIRQGFVENRLFGIYYSPNAGALFSVISFAAVAINVFLCKEKHNGKLPPALAVWFALNSVTQALYFSMTVSRGGLVTLITFCVMVALLLVYPKARQKHGKLKGLLIGVLAFALATGGAFAADRGIRYVIARIPDLSSSITLPLPGVAPVTSEPTTDEMTTEAPSTAEIEPSNNDGEPSTAPAPQNPVSFERIESNDDASNGRLTIWKTSLMVLLKNNPVFGLGDFNLDEEKVNRYEQLKNLANDSVEKGWMWRAHGNLHNAYVQVAVYSGAVGLALFLLLAALVFLKILLILIHGNPSSPLYPVLSLLLAVMTALAVNALFESHLMYRGPNMFWAIFWTITGITVLLAERFKASPDYKKEDDKYRERYAFAVASPLQGLHTINLATHLCKADSHDADCYVYHMFSGSREVSEKLRETGVFSNVYDVEEYKQYHGIPDRIVSLLRVLFPVLTLKKYGDKKMPLLRKAYRYILMSNAIPFMSDLKLAFPDAEVWFFEDGIGSYFGDFSARSPLFRKMDDFFFAGTKSVHPTKIYLSAPEISHTKMNCEVLPLPDCTDKRTKELSEYVFNYKENELYAEHRFIYLSQPFKGDKTDGYNETKDREIRAILQELCPTQALLRLHPRDTLPEDTALSVDEIRNLWELECIRQIGDDHVLIGAFSTSQFMPKILTGREPTIICTYKLLFSDLSRDPWPEVDRFISAFRKNYSGRDKIFCPETMEELKALLAKLQK